MRSLGGVLVLVVVRIGELPHARDGPLCVSGREAALCACPVEELYHPLGTQPKLVEACLLSDCLARGVQRWMLRQEGAETGFKVVSVRKVIGLHRRVFS